MSVSIWPSANDAGALCNDASSMAMAPSFTTRLSCTRTMVRRGTFAHIKDNSEPDETNGPGPLGVITHHLLHR